MGYEPTTDIAVSATAPTDSNDTTLLDTTTAFGPYALPFSGIKRISFSAEHSHSGTLKAYRSTNGGTTWDQYDERSVAAPGATTISGPFDYLVDTFKAWKLVWTNGGTTQTTWRPEMKGHPDRAPGG